jgi:hypothetical protein
VVLADHDDEVDHDGDIDHDAGGLAHSARAARVADRCPVVEGRPFAIDASSLALWAGSDRIDQARLMARMRSVARRSPDRSGWCTRARRR